MISIVLIQENEMIKDYAPQLYALLDAGMHLNDAITRLRNEGASPVETIKAILKSA